MEFILQFLSPAAHLGWMGYLLAFAITALEAIALFGAFIPGGTVIIALGGLSANGWYSPSLLIAFSILGAFVGDLISYELGRGGYERRIAHGRVSPELSRTDTMVRHYGALSIFIGRFIPPLRGIIPLAAGIVGMPRKTFTLANILSAFVWAPIHVGIGYAGGSFSQLLLSKENRPEVLTMGIVILIAIVLSLWWHYHRTHAHARKHHVL